MGWTGDARIAPSKLNNEKRTQKSDQDVTESALTVTLRLLTTLGFPSSRTQNRIFRFLVPRPRSGPSSLFATAQSLLRSLLRKEVIQPHLPIRLPCYDFTPIIEPTFGRAPLAVRLRTSGVPDSHGVTGGVYKARERIHRGMLIRDY